MGFLDNLRKGAGNAVDWLGTAANTPLRNVDLGISEFIAGGKTANTGRVANINPFGASPKIAPLAQPGAITSNPGNPAASAGGGGMTYDAAAIASAKKVAEDAAKKSRLKGDGNATLDQLQALYDQIVGEIQRVGADQTNRVSKDFDAKIDNQVTDMNNGMYEVDAGAAAGNLADSSFRSFDRGKVRTATDANINTLNSAREGSLSEIGSMVANDTAKYNADKAGIGRTRQSLAESDDLGEIQSTANSLATTRRGVEADKAKYNTTGEFAQRASKIGNYDTSAIENTLRSVVQNASATAATKAATIGDILKGTPLDEKKQQELKNKYTQTI